MPTLKRPSDLARLRVCKCGL